MRRTKIICTMGPATDNEDVLRDLMLNGMDVARLNFSHGSHEEALERINRIKKVRDELNIPVAILLDTKGPEVRIKDFKEGKVELKEGQKFTLCTDDVVGDENQVSITYANLPNDVKVGSKILIDGEEYLAVDVGGLVKGDHVDIFTETPIHKTYTAQVEIVR